MLSLLSDKDLQSHFSNHEFALKTQRQLIKDFGTVGIDFPADFNSITYPIDQLLFVISGRLKDLNSSNSSAFSQLLYQIDIPESILGDLTKADDFSFSLAEVVLKREAYKVYLRAQFSS